jgi:hypothetical protein
VPQLQFSKLAPVRFGPQLQDCDGLPVTLGCLAEGVAAFRGFSRPLPFIYCEFGLASLGPVTSEHFGMRFPERGELSIDSGGHLPMKFPAPALEQRFVGRVSN